MNIVHILLGKANPNRMNGVNKIAHKLATTQVGQGHNVTIVGLTNTPETDKVDRNYRLELFPRNIFFLDKNLLHYLMNVALTKSICHFHGGFISDFYFIARILVKCNTPYLITSHGCYNQRSMEKNYLLKRIYFLLFDRYILKNAWKVIFSGHIEYGDVDFLIKNINKKIVHNGQDIKDLNFSFSNITSEHRPVFGFLGRVDNYHKGLDKLFSGFCQYKKNGGRGILWVVGDGNDKSLLIEYSIKNGLFNDVVFWGAKYGDEKYNLIANMDVFVHTSRFEGFPMAVLEAAGLGKPLLLSKGTNFGKHVDKFKSGIVLNENTTIEIKDALFLFERYEKEGRLEEFSENSLNMIKTDFNWNAICEQLIH